MNAKNMDNILTPRRQGLAVIAALEAKGDQSSLEKAVAEALDNGLTISEAKEALSQLYAYTGFPRSLNALGTLQRVLDRRAAAGIKDAPGKDADPLPAGYDALKQGTAVQTKLSGRPFNYDFVPATDYYLKAHLFGDIFARNNLSYADREIVTVSAISALPGCEPQLAATYQEPGTWVLPTGSCVPCLRYWKRKSDWRRPKGCALRLKRFLAMPIPLSRP